jgi:hypothetical protein
MFPSFLFNYTSKLSFLNLSVIPSFKFWLLYADNDKDSNDIPGEERLLPLPYTSIYCEECQDNILTVNYYLSNLNTMLISGKLGYVHEFSLHKFSFNLIIYICDIIKIMKCL